MATHSSVLYPSKAPPQHGPEGVDGAPAVAATATTTHSSTATTQQGVAFLSTATIDSLLQSVWLKGTCHTAALSLLISDCSQPSPSYLVTSDAFARQLNTTPDVAHTTFTHLLSAPMPTSAKVGADDTVFFADQRRILHRLLLLQGGKADLQKLPRNSHHERSDLMPAELAMSRGALKVGYGELEEGFCIIPVSDAGSAGVSTVTLYVSTARLDAIPPNLRTFLLSGDGVSNSSHRSKSSVLSVVSVVASRGLTQPAPNRFPLTHYQPPKSNNTIHEEESGTVFYSNEGPVMIRGRHFTGCVYVKTVTTGTPDERVAPFFEGKKRRFQLQLQGRITGEGLDLSKGRVLFVHYMTERFTLSYGKMMLIRPITKALGALTGGRLQVTTGDEADAASHPIMAVPLKGFADSIERQQIPDIPLRVHNEDRQKVMALELKKFIPTSLDGENAHHNRKKKSDKGGDVSEKTFFDVRDSSYTMGVHSDFIDMETWTMRGLMNVDLRSFGGGVPYFGVCFKPDGVHLKDIAREAVFFLRLRVVFDADGETD